MNPLRVLVIAAHPDDEVLGCGGTIAHHVDKSDEVRVVFLADGVGARSEPVSRSGIKAREQAARSAGEVLGVHEIEFFRMPDNRLDGVDLLDVVQPLERVIRDFQPSIVYTHHGGDLSIDHRVVHRATMTACRPQPGGTVTRILCFETPSSTEWAGSSIGAIFHPTWFVEISVQLERKIAALQHYAAEMREFPHARSIDAVKALAYLRGCSVGLPAAEAFIIQRGIQR